MRTNPNSQAAAVASVATRKRERRNQVANVNTWVCKLRELRDQHKLTMDQVADANGLSKAAYWKIEHGGDIRLTNAAKLAQFFGKRIETIWPELISEEQS